MDCQHWSSLWIFRQVSNQRLNSTANTFLASHVMDVHKGVICGENKKGRKKNYMTLYKRNGFVSVLLR